MLHNSRILSTNSFWTGSSSSRLTTTADRPTFLRRVTATAERRRDDRRNSLWSAISGKTVIQY
ncbi:hypothetical protein CRUP_028979 [Coryphaenoides rupestris]|nr:hypothetical protein CRUP_028979 [Coryphaenoides rupestris]